MEIFVEWLYEKQEGYECLIEQSVKEALSDERVEVDVEVAIMIVDNERIKAINLEQRHMNKATDVLSFPLLVLDPSKDINQQIKNQGINPENDHVCLGDMVISWDKVLEQSTNYGHSISREFSFLIVHSMLHLLGYDHQIKEDEDKMLVKQKQIMSHLGLSR